MGIMHVRGFLVLDLKLKLYLFEDSSSSSLLFLTLLFYVDSFNVLDAMHSDLPRANAFL